MRYICFICFLLLCSVKARSQSTTVSGTIDIAGVLNITVTNLTGVVSFDDASDYQNGQTVLNAASIAVKSNVSWVVSMATQSAYFQAMSGTSSTNMPASVLGIRRNGTTTFLSMSTSAQTLKTGSKGDTDTYGNTFNTDVRINPGFNYNNGSYNIGVVYTISQQ